MLAIGLHPPPLVQRTSACSLHSHDAPPLPPTFKVAPKPMYMLHRPVILNKDDETDH